MRTAIKITHNGKTHSVAGWAQELGVAENTIRRRLRQGITVPEKLLAPANPTNTKLTIGGETKTLGAWAREHGLSYQIVYKRFKWGWPPEAIIKPPRKPMLITRGGVAKTIKEWAEELGVPESLVRIRKLNSWPEERWFEPVHREKSHRCSRPSGGRENAGSNPAGPTSHD